MTKTTAIHCAEIAGNWLGRTTVLVISLVSFAVLFCVEASAQSKPSEKISSELLHSGVASDLVVKFHANRPFDESIAHLPKEEKGRYVYNALRHHAESTQAGVRKYLDSRDISYRTYWIANAIWITGDVDVGELNAIAYDPYVGSISSNQQVLVSAVRQDASDTRAATPEWGIRRIGADSVWSMGYRGQGIVVGGEDTGYEWSHPAISGSYRGNRGDTVDHNYSWYDAIHSLSPLHNDTITDPADTPCGVNNPLPCDDHGHGTHTMGTMAGLEGDNIVGVAPDATWVGVRCMERGYGSPMTYIEGFEWFLAPTDVYGENPDPSKAPDVINNSWRCPPMEGCNPENYAMMRQAIANLKAAGVVVIVSAGNEGSGGCSSLADPPSIFQESFAVGATRSNDTIANFSSRGPVLADSSGRTKPDISAPGVGVRSAWLDSTYRSISGTSMSGPHVAGAVALILSANPALKGQVEVVEEILRNTARPVYPNVECEGDVVEIPNNSYGYGIIDVVAAVEAALNITPVESPENQYLNVRLFPNPVSSLLSYTVDTPPAMYHVSLTSMQGQVVLEASKQSRTGQIDVSRVAPGLYSIRLLNRDSGQSWVEKVVIAR